MAWADEMVPMLRHLIGDVTTTQSYDDARLTELLVVAAKLVIQEVDFSTSYVVSVDDFTISPDPATASDTNFIGLTVLKAACLLDQSVARTNALNSGIKIKDGQSEIDTRGKAKELFAIAEGGYCAAYEKAKFDFELGNTVILRAIIGPFSGDANPSIGGGILS